MVPYVSTCKACTIGSLASTLMVSLALRIDRVLLEITSHPLEGLRLLGRTSAQTVSQLHTLHYTCALSLRLWAPLIFCLVLLPLIARQCSALSLMV